MRTRYWSIGPFADWIRGTPSPGALTAEGWDDWNKMAKDKHPVRFWIADEGLRYLQDFVMWPIDKLYDIKYYINNRFVTRTHALTAHPRDIKPGQWQDVGYRFLPCLFNELQDYVEVELAWWHLAWASKEERAKYNMPWWAYGWFRIRTWRCPQAGLDNLAWQMTCNNKDYTPEDDPTYGELTQQAHNAKEILELYKWWTDTYRNRPDPYDASGWSQYCDDCRKENGTDSIWGSLREPKSQELKDRGTAASKRLHEIEAEYEQEEEDMMIRLIKVRRSLWT